MQTSDAIRDGFRLCIRCNRSSTDLRGNGGFGSAKFAVLKLEPSGFTSPLGPQEENERNSALGDVEPDAESEVKFVFAAGLLSIKGMMMKRNFCTALMLSAVVGVCGCASSATSNTARTAKEQMLLSNAVDQSLDKVDFTPLYRQKVLVDDKYLECVDKQYVVGSVRHRVMRAGGVLVADGKDAEIVMELRSGGVGTDTSESFLGTPEIALPGLLTIPEIRLAERKTQLGYSKIGMVIFDKSSGKVLGDGGMSMAQADDNNWYVFGVGPFQNGSLKGDVEKSRLIPRGMRQRQLPPMVAFGTRDDLVEEPFIQFASGTQEAEE